MISTPDKILRFKKQLEEERKLVSNQLESLGDKDETTGEWTASSGDIDQSATESDELADRMEQQEENADEIAALQPRLQDIKDALEKIEMGTYGVCEVGGEPIEEERLDVNPAARTCMKHL
jgi:RNA polymerase-binding transcription factor DksA